MGKISSVVILLLIIILGTLGFKLYNIEHQKKVERRSLIKEEKETSSSRFLFKTLKGELFEIEAEDKKFKIKGMEDKIVFLKVFGWNCKFCRKEIPQLIKMKNDLPNSFDVIAIEAQQHSKEESLEFVNEYGINYHVVMGENQKDFYTYLQESYGWNGVIPLTIVIAKGGNVLAFELGAKSYNLAELMQASLLRN